MAYRRSRKTTSRRSYGVRRGVSRRSGTSRRRSSRKTVGSTLRIVIESPQASGVARPDGKFGIPATTAKKTVF